MPFIDFLFFLANGLLSVLKWAIIIGVIMSWLLAFGVINPRNPVMGRLAYGLESFLNPFMAPLRAIIPSIGGLDLTPIVAILIIQGIQFYLLPAAHGAVVQAFGA